MTDKFDFDETYNDWNVLVDKRKSRQPIYKYEIEELLNNGVVPTKKAMPFLADAFAGKVMYSGKTCKPTQRPENILIRQNIALEVLVKARILTEQQKNNKKKRGDETPLEEAKQEAAEKYGISIRNIENYLSTYKEDLMKILNNMDDD